MSMPLSDGNMTPHIGRKLRVGIALEAAHVPAWQAATIRSLRMSDCADIVCRLELPPRSDRSNVNLVHRTFEHIEDSDRRGAPDALALESVESLLDGIARIEHDPLARSADFDCIAAIRAYELDVLVAFSGVEVLSKAGPLAQFGLWYFEVNGIPFAPANGFMVGFSEVLDREPCLAGALRIRLANTERELVAVQTHSAVHPRSHFLTRNEHLWKCSSFVDRVVRKCHAMEPSAFLQSLPEVSRNPTNHGYGHLAFSFGRYLSWRVRQKLTNKRVSQRWVLLWAEGRHEPGSDGFKLLEPPPGRFWADPHVIQHDGVEHIYFEDASCTSGKGHIAHVELRNNRVITDPIPVLERPYHLSYPFVFAWQGEHYMIPESADNHVIELYRCARFPDRWEFVHNLIENIKAYDSTLIEHNGRWWMFANVSACDGASSWDELCIFHSDSPVSRQWQPHCENPVISDVRRARPAGRLFRDGMDLIRPSQDSSGYYGRSLVFNRVIELSEFRYVESKVKSIDPDWDPSIAGIHSYSSTTGVTLIDAILRESR